MRWLSVITFTVLSLSVAEASETLSKVSGYVTAVSSSDTFYLEGVRILTTPATRYSARTHGSAGTLVQSKAAPVNYFLGETLDAIGTLDHSTHTLTATEVVVIPASEASVHGIAIIDLIPASPAALPTSDRIVRADGYLLHITAQTKLNLDTAIKSISDISTNQWIDYSGIQQLDGTVVLEYAGIGLNRITPIEDDLRTRSDYDPSSVPHDAHQGNLSKGFLGLDPKRIPAYHDQRMQARVERIGQSLIPAYQRALPNADPTRIHFRFQVIDSNRWDDAWTLSSGVILVPRQVIERMENDDQLAAVLARNIAENLQKEYLRSRAALAVQKIGAATTTASLVLLSPTGLAAGLVTRHVASSAIDKTVEQSGRVSLCLLHDAGYDITQAPLAWWLLAPKNPQPITETKMPPRAITLYESLGTTWHPVVSISNQPLPTAPKQ